MQPPEKRLIAGKFTTVHGVKGWLKIHSYTVPETNIFDYQPWWVKFADGWKKVEVDQHQSIAKGFIAHIPGLDDREAARLFCQHEIEVSPDQFSEAEEGEYYWYQLEGLQVISVYDGGEQILGHVSGFLETGANDVVVVKPTPDSIDDIERLLPYIDHVIVDISLASGQIRVDWNPEFETQ